MFIVSGKSRCGNVTFTNVLFTSPLSKNIFNKNNFRYVNSAFPQLHCLKFSFKSFDISESYAK